MRIMIADDEQYIRTALAEELDWSKHGIELLGAASDGREALELCRRLAPDLLVTDIRMPYYSGIEVMKLLRHERPAMKFILLSGWSEFEYAREALRLGASNYLVKPCPDEEIVEAILAVLQEHGGSGSASSGAAFGEEKAVPAKRHAVKLACELIHKDLSAAVSLTEIAAQVNMNASALSRLFRQEMGCSFSEFVTSARMNRAKKLLIDTNRRIQDISQSVGYVSVSHFVQVFGDYTGMTPGTFRERNG